MWFDNSASISAGHRIFSPIETFGASSFSTACHGLLSVATAYLNQSRPPAESEIHAAGEVELVQRILQRLDFGVQLGNQFIHVHLAKLGDVFDFVGRFSKTATFVEYAGL